MYTTKMPGFTADDALYRRCANYQINQLPNSVGQRREGRIRPARRGLDGPGCECTDVWGDGSRFDCTCRVDTGGGQSFTSSCMYTKNIHDEWEMFCS